MLTNFDVSGIEIMLDGIRHNIEIHDLWFMYNQLSTGYDAAEIALAMSMGRCDIPAEYSVFEEYNLERVASEAINDWGWCRAYSSPDETLKKYMDRELSETLSKMRVSERLKSGEPLKSLLLDSVNESA